MKKIFTKEVIIGLSVAAALVILIFGIEFLKGINMFKPSNFYVAQYENVSGLEVAAPVLIDGYKVGQVREINFNYEKPGKIEVVLSLNKHLRLPQDSKAVIGSTLLSGSYVEIKMGSSSEMIPVGGDISSEMTPDLMATVSDNILPAVGNIMPKVDSLLISVNNLAADPALAASLKNLEIITNNMTVASKSLNVIMQDLQKRVPGVLNGANVALDNVDVLTANLKQLSEELNKLPLNQTMNNVNSLTANLDKFSASLNNRNSTLGQLTNDAELYDRLNRVVSDIDSLIVDIQKNPKRYISIKLL